MATYRALTNWQTAYNSQSGTTWMGAGVRIVMDADASTADSYVLYAECSAYQRPGKSSTYNCLWYYDGQLISPPMYHSATWSNGTGAIGSTYRVLLGTYTAGQTATTDTWYIRIDFYDYGSRDTPHTLTASYTVPSAPAAPTGITNTRVSDNQNTIAWTLPSTTYTRIRLQQIADSTMAGEWTFASGLTSYVDTSTAAGHAYTYRVRLEYVPEAGEDYTLASAWVTSSATYNSPAAPTAISGARLAGTTVRVTLTNTASTSTGLEVQASTSSSDWSGAISQTFAGAGLTTADITGLGGIYYFRARNTRGALVSAWSPVSAAVATLTPPAAPTLIAPNSAVWNISTPSIVYKWQHNPLDGSAQTAAQLQTSTDGGSTWTTYTESTAQSHTVTYSGADVGKTITWRVRTKGADASYGAYSASKSFLVAQAPSISITLEDSNGNDVTNGTLTDMPLRYALTVNDPSGTVAGATVEIGGYSEDATSLSGEISAVEFLPLDGTTYTFTANVQSTSTLAASGAVTVTTSFVMPQAGTLAVSDADGIETLTVGLAAQEAGETAAVSIAVYREYAGKTVLLAQGLADGDTITDLYAPLNVDYAYIVATFSSAGIARQTRFPQRIKCSKWLVVYNGKVASAIWNPAGDIALKRPQRTLVQYIGRTYPVSYDGTALADERSMSWVLLSEDERDAFIDLMQSGGAGVYKSGDGAVFMAVFDVKFKPAYTTRTQYGTVSLTITRTESGAL